MILAFILTMPGAPSWNGRWSGDEHLNAQTRTLPNSRKWREHADSILGFHSFCWPDGWRASVEVREVNVNEARRIRRKSRGFAGYGWMVDSLLLDGTIQTGSQRREAPHA